MIMTPVNFRSLLGDQAQRKAHFETTVEDRQQTSSAASPLAGAASTSPVAKVVQASLPSGRPADDHGLPSAKEPLALKEHSVAGIVEETPQSSSFEKDSDDNTTESDDYLFGLERAEQSTDVYYRGIFNNCTVRVDALQLLEDMTGTVHLNQVVESVKHSCHDSEEGQRWLVEYLKEAEQSTQDGQRLQWLCEISDVVY